MLINPINGKLSPINDYQQYLAHFDWFLSPFQISDVKHEFLLVKLKKRKNSQGYFVPKSKFCAKIWVKMASKLVFIGGAEYVRCCFM